MIPISGFHCPIGAKYYDDERYPVRFLGEKQRCSFIDGKLFIAQGPHKDRVIKIVFSEVMRCLHN